ncbi:MAG: hypothetical protein Q7S82_00185 [bacterium]|nr:hypothetical protein [bacterium]
MTLQRKIYLAIFSFFVLASLVAGFIFAPLFLEIQKGSKELISQKAKISALELKIKNLKQSKNVYYGFNERLKEADKLFINSQMPVEFIVFLEKISKDSQIKTKISLAAFGQTEENTWPSLAFQIDAEGASSNLFRFFEKLENVPYLTEIQNITFNQSAEKNTVRALFSLKVYTK